MLNWKSVYFRFEELGDRILLESFFFSRGIRVGIVLDAIWFHGLDEILDWLAGSFDLDLILFILFYFYYFATQNDLVKIEKIVNS